ncbi:MAG TPA: peroxide stress protein YaaA [Acidimicrobiales bacterium]
MSRPPLLLLPPSEGKAPGGLRAGRPGTFAEELSRPRAAVVAELGRVLRSASVSTRSAVLGVRGVLLERALAATDELLDDTAPVLPAWRRYSGVVWAGLDPATVTPADRRRILVPSGLYGMTTAADPVADYRLRLSVSLGRLGRLSTFWRPTVTPALCRRARGRVVVDLLPAEHVHAFDLTALASSTRVVQVRFVSADGRRAVGHEAKSAKGRLARAVLDEGLEAVHGFAFEGWRTVVDGDLVTVVAPTP